MKDPAIHPARVEPETVEERRAKRKAALAADRAAQYQIDLAALDALEVEHGDGCVASLETNTYVKGQPTMMVVKSPGGGTPFYTRYLSQVRLAGKNAQAIGAAQAMLGESCIVYPPAGEPGSPEDAARKSFFAAFPGATLSAGIRAVKFVELDAEEEKKG